ncbi:MAG: DUF5915 domain-containing protein, partial [Lachnospiraceae bacterium]|nr:DUF5915 domain-containing protein [Lachnospiraceae bacterium]
LLKLSEDVALAEEDLLIEMHQQEGYASESNGDVTVVLDGNLTEELIEEGFVRELISKIQTGRKDAGFEVTDHIFLSVSGNDRIADIVSKNADEICRICLVDGISGEAYEDSKDWNINGEDVKIGVKKV